MKALGCVTLVGAGPGDPELLTVKAVRLIREADAVVFDRLVGDAILALIPAGAMRICVGKESGHHPIPQQDINDILIRLAKASKRVVRLKGGDPFIFGRGGEEMQALARHGIPVDVVPGITAALGCAAAAGIPLTHRDAAQGLRLVTGHLREDKDLELDWARLADPSCTLVVYMGLANAGRIAAGLMEGGLPADMPAAVIEQGTTGRQRTLFCRLDGLADTIARHGVRPPALMVIGKAVDMAVPHVGDVVAGLVDEARAEAASG